MDDGTPEGAEDGTNEMLGTSDGTDEGKLETVG